MGKGGRFACIFTPFVLTLASFVCIILVEVAGWSKSTLPSYYFMRVDFTNVDLASASGVTEIALAAIKSQDDYYQIHLWNYCASDNADGKVTFCSDRKAEYTFDPVEVWGLNTTVGGGGGGGELQAQIDAIENKLLGSGVQDALKTYQKASKAMFIIYAICFWTLIATILAGILAIFSRWGSLFTWIFASVSALLYLAGTGLATGIFVILTDALRNALDKYDVSVDLGKRVLVVSWLGTAFIWAATLFWLFSICCCSGRSNPHHRSNTGGLWNRQRGNGYEYGEKSGYRNSANSSGNVYDPPTHSPYEPYRPHS